MSTRYKREGLDVARLQQNPARQYLGMIEGCPLLWDDQAHGPYWPEGEPQSVTYEADGGIMIDCRCDINKLPPWVRQPKPLDCRHEIRGEDIYVTWLETGEDVCLACATRGDVSDQR